MERLRTDYCVVGAGFAGLAAARRLRDRGKSVALLEARDRVGGRVWNRTAADGTVVSVGGTWLGKRQDRMFEFCRELGVEVYPQYDRGDTVIHLDGANRRYQGYPKIGLFALLSLGLAFWQLNRMAKRLPLEEPWKASGAKELDSLTLGAWVASRWNVPSATARKLMNTTMTTLFCVDPDEVSLLGSFVLARGGGGFEYYVNSTNTETHLVDGGAPELAVRLAAKLGDALHLSSPVRSIKQSDAGVEVFSDRLTVDARRVIVATPPLLASRIEYDPLLPAAQSQLLRRMLSGSIAARHHDLRRAVLAQRRAERHERRSRFAGSGRARSIAALGKSRRSQPVTCSDRKRSGLQRWIPWNDATFGCAHWRCGTDPKRYRQGPIWKPIGPRNNGRSAA